MSIHPLILEFVHASIHSSIHSFIQTISIGPQNRSRYSRDTVPEFQAEAPQATAS